MRSNLHGYAMLKHMQGYNKVLFAWYMLKDLSQHLL